jgi:hypothetical protein
VRGRGGAEISRRKLLANRELICGKEVKVPFRVDMPEVI